MSKPEAMRLAIESNLKEYSPGIFLHAGVPFQCAYGSAVAAGHTSKMVVIDATGVYDGGLKKFIAAARRAGFEELKMPGASILVIDSEYKADHWRVLRELRGEDGRILGMQTKVTESPGVLPLGASFVIIDPPDAAESPAEKSGDTKTVGEKDPFSSIMASKGFLGALKSLSESMATLGPAAAEYSEALEEFTARVAGRAAAGWTTGGTKFYND